MNDNMRISDLENWVIALEERIAKLEAAQQSVHPTGGTHCPECGFPNGKVVTHTCVSHPTASG